MPSESGPTSPTAGIEERKNSIDGDCNGRNGSAKMTRAISYDPTEYVQKARVTKATPPKPAYNPMQFVQIKPCNLYQTAQEQLKKSEEVKKVKEVVKEDAEEWQYNLDNWKSSRRKRVEHIIDRVVEVKKLELVDHDRNRRKSKTFSEMMEERGTRRKISLPIYAEDESNDLSDLGIGTSSASCKSSVSEDYDNNSVISDNDKDTEKSLDLDTINPGHLNGGNRDYTSSPGYDTSSSTAPASSPDPSEYTYEGAIQDYKQRVSRAGQPHFGVGPGNFSKDSTPERMIDEPITKKIIGGVHTPRKKSFSSKIEDKMSTFDGKANEEEAQNGGVKKDLPKVDITKRRELFEKEKQPTIEEVTVNKTRLANDFSSSKSIKERLSSLGKPAEDTAAAKKVNRLSGDIPTIRDRFSNLEKQLTNGGEKPAKLDVELTTSLKDRLTSLQSAVNKEEVKKPVVLVDIKPMEDRMKEETVTAAVIPNGNLLQINESHLTMCADGSESENLDTDREDSGIHTTDVSCSVSQADEQNEERIEELINIEEHKESSIEKEMVASSVIPDLLTPQILQLETVTVETNVTQMEHFGYIKNDNTGVDLDDTIGDQDISVSATNKASISNFLTSMTTSSEVVVGAQETTNTNNIILNGLKAEARETKVEVEKVEKVVDDVCVDKSVCEVVKSVETTTPQVIEALELALQEIDSETSTNQANEFEATPMKPQPIYENIEEVEQSVVAVVEPQQQMEETTRENERQEEEVVALREESHYQVPKPAEPYYEVPKKMKPIPVYENVDIFYAGDNMAMPIIADEMATTLLTIATKPFMEPPKEKPPPPPVEEMTDGEEGNETDEEQPQQQQQQQLQPLQEKYTVDNFKRINSTKRIKKEIRNKRSSFLGIEGSMDDDNMLELSVAPPPDMAALLKEEKRLEKQMFMKVGFCDNSDTGESRDSGVSENHSRQSSDPSSATLEHLQLNDSNIIELLVNEERRRSNEVTNTDDDFWSQRIDDNKLDEETRIQCLEDQIREQEEVLRVERELLQLEQEELKRQRENLLIRENLARHELDHGAKMLMSTNRQNSLQNINNFVSNGNNGNNYANLPLSQYQPQQHNVYQIQANYRQSMPDLQNMLQDHNVLSTRVPPSPPAKPQRVGHYQQEYSTEAMHARQSSAPIRHHPQPHQLQHSLSSDEFGQLRTSTTAAAAAANIQYGNMTKHTLHALSAVPKSKLTNNWVQHRKSEQMNGNNHYVNYPTNDKLMANNRLSESAWALNQQKRKSDPQGFNYNKHWLIQEAEQRRIEQQCGVRGPTKKPLPDSVIQTITQRVQSLGIGERRRKFETSNLPVPIIPIPQPIAAEDPSAIPILTHIPETTDKILSVSGKKKCSHCGQELGRGAAMIIESLRLFYHIDCFKCCVCRVQLGDGLNGTDVRVRNNKLHCHNCYSSDDGVKFSCV